MFEKTILKNTSVTVSHQENSKYFAYFDNLSTM